MSRSSSHLYDPPAPSAGELLASSEKMDFAGLVYDRRALRAIDRDALVRYGIPTILLMENAARGLADETAQVLRRVGDFIPHVVVFCGTGNNGGDGYGMARHLHNLAIDVTIVPIGFPKANSDAAIQDEICHRMNIRRIDLSALDNLAKQMPITLMVDAILGTGLDRPVEGIVADAIQWINDNPQPVLAADIPSGLDGDTGKELGAAVRATRTVTFVGLKKGFVGLDVQKILGEVVIKDIGVPRELLERHGRRREAFHSPPEPPEHGDTTNLHLRRPGE